MKWYVFRVWQNRYRITYCCFILMLLYLMTIGQRASTPVVVSKSHAKRANQPVTKAYYSKSTIKKDDTPVPVSISRAEKVIEQVNLNRLGVEAEIVHARKNVDPDIDNDNVDACHMQNVTNPSTACKQYCINKNPRARGCFCAQIVGYSQFGQDLAIIQYLQQKGLSTHNKFFVDIGAYDGVWSSNTYLLERCFGWRGVCIEAEPENFKDLTSVQNPRTCTKLHVAMGKDVGHANILHSSTVSTVMINSTENKRRAGTEMSSVVPMTTLNNVLHAFNIRFVDFMSMDIEGAELDVIQSSGLTTAHIDTITVEISNSDSSLQSAIIKQGYTVLKTLGEDVFFNKNKN